MAFYISMFFIYNLCFFSDFVGLDPWVWIPGFGLLGLDSWVWSPGLGFLGLDSWVWSPGFGVLCLNSWIWTPGLNLMPDVIKSMIWKPKLRILGCHLPPQYQIIHSAGEPSPETRFKKNSLHELAHALQRTFTWQGGLEEIGNDSWEFRYTC